MTNSDTHNCPICAEPFKPDDICADDITEGTCHASCLEGSPVVDLETGEENGGTVDTYPYSEVMDPPPQEHLHLRGVEPQSETADPDRVYFQFVRGDAFGQDENRLRIRKWDTKPFDGASEYIFSPAHHATSSREAARQEAVRLIERAGLEMEEEYDLLVDDISETMLRFAAVPSPQEHMLASRHNDETGECEPVEMEPLKVRELREKMAAPRDWNSAVIGRPTDLVPAPQEQLRMNEREAFDEWCKDRDLIRASLRDAFEAGFAAAPSQSHLVPVPALWAECAYCKEAGEEECLHPVNELRWNGEQWCCEECGSGEEPDAWQDAPQIAIPLLQSKENSHEV